ncbi:MAG: hypothetical protein O3A19_03270 [Planctomycetota bacterium]|nr:hypothetical protein [Planctomycetota bacterium]MDA1025425.1 hypothetical protein [Planctomycetota bacterium]
MAANERTPKELQTAGAILVVVGVLGAWGLTWLPVLFAAKTTEYLALIPLSIGARGLEAGGPVLYGGAPRGEITSVRTERDLTTGMPTEIQVGFTLNSSLPLAANAAISKSLGIAGTNGAIAISDPGTHDKAFKNDEERILRIKSTGAESGSGALTLLGRENSRLLTNISEDLSRMGDDLPPHLRAFASSFRRLKAILENLQIEVDAGLEARQTRFDDLIAEGRAIEEHLLELRSGIGETQPIAASLQTNIDIATRNFANDGRIIRRRSGEMQETMQGILEDRGGELTPKIRGMQRDLVSALDESRRLIGATSELLPEMAASIRPSMARMALAGGQLAFAFDDLLPLVIEAVLISPDAASESRRRTLQAVQDAVLAGSNLRDAARRLENFATMNRPLLESNPELAPIVADPLTDAVSDLEKMLQRLAEVLRREILEPLGSLPATEP